MSLTIINNFELDSLGHIETGKQGAEASDFGEGTDITVDGILHRVKGTLATASVRVLWDADDDVPTDWEYLWLKADQFTYLQVIGVTTNFIIGVLALVPFTLSHAFLLAAADTTLIEGGTEPTLEAIDSVVLGNYSGSPTNFLFNVVK